MTDTAELKPVAWRVKDYADGWIFYTDEKRARIEAEIMSGALVEPLYSADALSSLVRERDEARAEAKAKHRMFLYECEKHSEWLEKFMAMKAMCEAAEARATAAEAERDDALSHANELMVASRATDTKHLAARLEYVKRAVDAEADAARMREALEPFQDIDGEGDEDFPDETPVIVTFGRSTVHALTLGDFRRASAAPSNTSEGGEW